MSSQEEETKAETTKRQKRIESIVSPSISPALPRTGRRYLKTAPDKLSDCYLIDAFYVVHAVKQIDR